MMRKKIRVALILLLTFVITCSFAETYQFDSLDFSITCPSNWIPYYKDLSDKQLRDFQLTKQDVSDTIKHYQLYDTDFVLDNYDEEITLMIIKDKAQLNFRLKDKDDAFLKGFLGTFIPGIEQNNGLDITEYELYQTDDNLFIRYECPSPNPMISFFTTADGISYCFSFIFYNRDGITDEMRKLSEEIMQTVLWKW